MIHIVSPHIDDAMLSMGGTIVKLCQENKDFNIIYVFTTSQWTNPEAISGLTYPVKTDEVTDIRIAEEIAIAQQLQYNFQVLEFPDLPLRKKNTSTEESSLTKQITDQLKSIIDIDDELFFPLGINHHDHKIVNHIGIDLSEQGYNLNFYEDLPYVAMSNNQLYSHFDRIQEMNYEPVLTTIDIEAKLEVLKNYKSQLSWTWLNYVKSYAYSLPENKYFERYWRPSKH